MTLSPQQINQLKSGMTQSNSATGSMTATHDWVDSLSEPDNDPTSNANVNSQSDSSPSRNLLQSSLGSFFDPIIQGAARTGQAVGATVLRGVNDVSGGKLDKYAKGGSVDAALSDYGKTNQTIPGLNTPLPSSNSDTAENVGGRALSTVGLGAGGAATAGAVIGAGNAMSQNKGAGSVAVDTVVSALAGKILEHGFSAVAPYVEQAAMKFGTPILDKISQYVPDSAKNLISNIADKIPNPSDINIMPSSVSDAVNNANNSIPNAIDKPLDRVATALKDKSSDIIDSVADRQSSKDLEKIQDTIAPKLNAKETRTAINEGRVTRGKDSMLYGKLPDTVSPSEDVQRYSTTIKNNIPGASKMNDVQLSNALDDHTTMMAKNLGGEMKSVPVNDESISKVSDSWNKIKAEQQSSPEFLDNEAGNKSFQGKFENYLKSAQDGKTLDDIWQARKDYDASIPTNVKQATEASSPVLQTRKAMWLDNRSLLNSIVNDTASGLGETSQKAFSEMSDMYGAKQNILSKAKIDQEGISGGSKVKGFLKKHSTALKIGGALTAEHAIKDFTGLGI